MFQHYNWEGHSFEVHPHSSSWADKAGIYVFAAPAGLLALADRPWTALYVGQAASFADRLPRHERWHEARAKNATHVHALCVPNQADRDALEQHLIRVLQPVLNTQHKSFHPGVWGIGDASRGSGRSPSSSPPAAGGIGLWEAFGSAPSVRAHKQGLLQMDSLDDADKKPKLLVVRKGLLSQSR